MIEHAKELQFLINLIWTEEEEVLEDLLIDEMMKFCKKNCKDYFRNYKALGLPHHAFKLLSPILLILFYHM